MYEELVKRLRGGTCEQYGNECDGCDYSGKCTLQMEGQAADAIEALDKGYQMMAEAYEYEVTKPRWISVKERLPEVYDEVLLQFQHNQAAGFWNGDCWCVHSGDDFYTEVAENEGKPTHWANKLPEPPKEET